MRRLFAHVGCEGRDCRPTDPAALEADVRAEIDLWEADAVNADGLPVDNRRNTDYYLLAFDRAALERYLASYEQPPSDREIRLEHVAARPDLEYGETREHWRTYYVVKQPMLDTKAIREVQTETNPVTGAPAVMFVLTSEGKAAFGAGTAASVGKKVATMIDGAITSAPIINGAIKGGRFSINVPTKSDADALIAKLSCVK